MLCKYIIDKTGKQNIEIKSKLTVTRGEGGGDKRGKQGKGHQRTCIKDTWAKPTTG